MPSGEVSVAKKRRKRESKEPMASGNTHFLSGEDCGWCLRCI